MKVIERKALQDELKRYKKGFFILHAYFDSISEEEQVKVNKQLDKLGL